MKRNSGLIGWIVLIVGLLCSVRGGAVDVGSAAALRDALGNATVSGNVVMLTGDVSLSSTLNITGGTMILDLNGMQISITKNKAEAKCISVTGGTLEITGGGFIRPQELNGFPIEQQLHCLMMVELLEYIGRHLMQ